MIGRLPSSLVASTVKVILESVGVDIEPVLPLVDTVQCHFGDFVQVVEDVVMEEVEGGTGLGFSSPRSMERDISTVSCSQLVISGGA